MASATVQSTALADDYAVLSGACGLLDRSERGKLALAGPGAVEFLNGQLTNDVARLRPGEGCYAAFLTPKGKMLGDLRVLACRGARTSDGAVPPDGAPGENSAPAEAGAPGGVSELLLDTERVALQALFDMIRRYSIGYEVQLHKRTLECALFSLIGPHARAVAAAACARGARMPDANARGEAASGAGGDGGSADGRLVNGALEGHTDELALPEAEHSHVAACVAGAPVRLIATEAGGVDVLLDAAHGQAVWDALLRAGATAVGEQAAEVLRVERGLPRYGIDMDQSTIPQEAGLNERAVSFTKGCYVGQETVARLHYRGKPNRHLRGLRLSAPAATGAPLRLGERAVGTLGSAVVSPRFGPIGLALVRREAQPGARVSVGEDEVGAEVVALPFA